MLNRSSIHLPLIICATHFMTACGGGGGGGGGEITQPSSTSSSSIISSISSTSSQAAQLPLTQRNTPEAISGYLDLLFFAKETAADIVNGKYRGKEVGSFKGVCDENKGSYETIVSNSGNHVEQRYQDCQLSITTENGTETLLISGEETIVTTDRESINSSTSITWKNYSISTIGTDTLTIDGSFNYEGLLYFSSSAGYSNVTSRIKINAQLTEGNNSIEVKNADFVVDFPSIFDRYDGAGGQYTYEHQKPHLFAKNILSASASISTNNVTANFNFDQSKQRVTLSNNSTAKSYLDIAPNGFYIKFDEQNDGTIDANVFITATEHAVLSENATKENNEIYFTRYPNAYVSLPPRHTSTGSYERITLSKGATAEINAQELFTNTAGALLHYEINNQSTSEDWEQVEAGRFILSFPNSQGYETYELKITAVDLYGNRSPAIIATVYMNDNLADTDNDGIADIDDLDIDNDGVPNINDAFPKDPTEQDDLDGDGIGDNKDSDKDGDGTENALDFYPEDNSCHKQESGDSSGCFLTNARYSFTDKNQIAYFIQHIGETDTGKIRLIRFDTNTNSYLSPSIALDFAAGYKGLSAYNAEHHSIIAQNYRNNQFYILKLDDFSTLPLKDFTDEFIYSIYVDHGYFVLAVRSELRNDAPRWVEVYDGTGALINSSKEQELDLSLSDIYYSLQPTKGIPFCEFSISVGIDGQLITTGDESKRNNDNCENLIQVSKNGLYAFSQIGASPLISIYNTAREKVAEIEGIQPQWLGDQILYIEPLTYDLILKNLSNQSVIRLPYLERGGQEVSVAGDKIMVAATPNNPSGLGTLKIFDNTLQLIYDSKNY